MHFGPPPFESASSALHVGPSCRAGLGAGKAGSVRARMAVRLAAFVVVFAQRVWRFCTVVERFWARARMPAIQALALGSNK